MNDQSAPHCYRHPDRETHIRCQRCSKSICPDCMREASVGFQCPDCVKEGSKSTRQAQAARGMHTGDPRITSWVLIGSNVAVFVAILAVPKLVDWLSQHALPYCQTDQGTYVLRSIDGWQAACQEVGGTAVPGIYDGAWWQAVTQMFTHEAIWHIASNMFVLYLLGPLVESALGRARFLAVYLVSGLAGGLAALLLSSENSGVLGASGAIWGLMAAALVLAVKNNVRSVRDQMLQLVALNVVVTAIGFQFFSWQGHLGGFLGGAAATAVIALTPPEAKRSTVQYLGIGAVAALVVAGYVVKVLIA